MKSKGYSLKKDLATFSFRGRQSVPVYCILSLVILEKTLKHLSKTKIVNQS